MPNAEEIEYWNTAGRKWAQLWEAVDRVFTPITQRLLESAAAAPGESVLDVGCGSGETTLALARAVGANGSVAGIDVSVPMLEVARARSAESGLDNLGFIEADAATTSIGRGRFDLIFSRFGVMFFDSPEEAFANLRRDARAGGRLVFACWRELAANPWFAVPANAVRPFAPPQPPADPRAPGPMALCDREYVHGLLERAGYRDIAFEPFDANLSLGTPDDALTFLCQIGPTSRMLAESESDAREQGVASLRAALRANEHEGEVRFGGGVWIVRARIV